MVDGKQRQGTQKRRGGGALFPGCVQRPTSSGNSFAGEVDACAGFARSHEHAGETSNGSNGRLAAKVAVRVKETSLHINPNIGGIGFVAHPSGSLGPGSWQEFIRSVSWRAVNHLNPIARQALGWAFVGAGLVGLLVPMIPGSLFIAVGALLLAPYVKTFRRVSAWFHKNFPHLRRPMRRFRRFKRRSDYILIQPEPSQNGLAKCPADTQSGVNANSKESINTR